MKSLAIKIIPASNEDKWVNNITRVVHVLNAARPEYHSEKKKKSVNSRKSKK